MTILCNRPQNESEGELHEIKTSVVDLRMECNTKLEFVILDKNELPIQFYAESETIPMGSSSKTESDAVLDYHEEIEPALLNMVPRSIDATYASNDYIASNIQNWLERPRVIVRQVWTPASTFAAVEFAPWGEFLNGATSAFLRSKINQYFLLRGNLKIKVMVNGSQFHYGRARLVYRPGATDNSYPSNMDPRTVIAINNYAGVTSDLPLLTLYSQRPGVYIDPGTNLPVEMMLPFFSLKNYIDLRSAVLDMSNLGVMMLYVQNELQHSNGAIDPVTITIMASMTNVELSTPTEQDVFLGQSSDEYGQGVISKPATALSRLASKLSDVPFIGKFAMATQIAASSVAKISSIWGYSKPVTVTNTLFMRPRPFGSMAVIAGEDAISKLSLDPKQEVSIDPTTVGIDSKDQMAIAFIAQREALLCTFGWSTLNAAGAILAALKVHPRMVPHVSSTLPTLDTLIQTPLSFVSAPFLHWRGGIKYRVQIVCASNHRGKILIQYDPNMIGANSAPNIQSRFSQVIDITEGRDMTFCVNYNRSEMYLLTNWDLGSQLDVTTVPTGTFETGNIISSNGCLIFSVFNELAAPIATSAVEINVYVSAADDFELANPTSDHLNLYSYSEGATLGGVAGLQSEEEPILQNESEFTPMADCENEPEQCTFHIINGTSLPTVNNDMKKVMYGEQIRSIRTLMRRYCLVDINKATNNATGIIKATRIVRPDIPAGPGIAYGSSTPATTAGVRYNYAKMCYIRYFMGAYAAYKGAVRYKYIESHTGGLVSYLKASRRTDYLGTATRAVTDAITLVTAATDTGAVASFIYAGTVGDEGSKSGMEMMDRQINGGVEFELPWMSAQRFQYCHTFVNSTESASILPYTDFQRHNHQVLVVGDSNHNTSSAIQLGYCATGEDFSLFFFINAPITYLRDPQVPP